MGQDRNTDSGSTSTSHEANESTAARQSRGCDDTTAEQGDQSGRQERSNGKSERGLRPAVTRHDPDEEGEEVSNGFTPTGPLEPQEIDLENAAFVLLGATLLTGLMLAAVAGL